MEILLLSEGFIKIQQLLNISNIGKLIVENEHEQGNWLELTTDVPARHHLEINLQFCKELTSFIHFIIIVVIKWTIIVRIKLYKCKGNLIT